MIPFALKTIVNKLCIKYLHRLYREIPDLTFDDINLLLHINREEAKELEASK